MTTRTAPKATAPAAPKRVTYTQAVTQGRAAVRNQETASWTLGDIAANVAPKYGDNTLQKLAEDISAGGYGITYKTLINFRTVANAYAPAERSELNTFTVHVKFAKLDNRVTLVNSRVWTVAEAAEFVRKLNAGEIDADGNAYGDNDGDNDGDTDTAPANPLDTAEAEVDRLFGELTKAVAKVNKLRRAAGLPAYAKVAQPAPTAPKVAQPAPTGPKVAQPKATAPKATAPKATAPKATAPKATVRPTKASMSSAHAVVSGRTAPKATAPKATAPKATARRLPTVTASSGSLAEARTRHARTLAGVAK